MLAVDSCLHGYEIKSDADTLKRLPEQSREYASVCRYLTLVVGEKHVQKSFEIVPDWWGLIVAGDGLRVLREPHRNERLNPVCLAGMLWKGEMCEILRAKNPPKDLFGVEDAERLLEQRLMRRTGNELRQRLVSTLTPEEIEKEVCKALRERDYANPKHTRQNEVIDCRISNATATVTQGNKPTVNVSVT